jgi:curved DNA-binding protein CbpA
MTDRRLDPYQTLDVARDASEVELRAAYRRLVQLHHPDHNNGSPESARRFADVQQAYSQIVAERRSGARRQTPYSDGAINARLAEMERELQAAKLAKERARQAAAKAAAGGPRPPTPEELGYVTTDDSLSKILDDARDELGRRWEKGRDRPLSERLADLFSDEP